jgi:hypothetical protein
MTTIWQSRGVGLEIGERQRRNKRYWRPPHASALGMANDGYTACAATAFGRRHNDDGVNAATDPDVAFFVSEQRFSAAQDPVLF